MTAGLYTKFNLSESGLNSTEAVQKLYAPQVQQDILLFAFSKRLESSIFSPSLTSTNQLYAIINRPFSDSQGNISLRTKFLTRSRLTPDSALQGIYTFSDNNLVWFDKIPAQFDRRSPEETAGAPIKTVQGGALVSASISGVGEEYFVTDETGAIITTSTFVNATVEGLESGANSAAVRVRVLNTGSLDGTFGVQVVTPGSGYIIGESLRIIPKCPSGDLPAEDKCLNYTGTAINHRPFANGKVSKEALLKSELYTYRVVFSGKDGFFLYDDRVDKYVYLGTPYNVAKFLEPEQTPSFVIKRKDSLSSENFSQLYRLNGVSSFFSYFQNFSGVRGGISANTREVSERAEELRESFKDFLQNTKLSTKDTDSKNTLSTQFNIFEGKNLSTDFRILFRDPDGVLDEPEYEDDNSTYVQSGQTITVTTSSVHGLAQGDRVTLTVNSGLALSSSFRVTSVVDGTGFTVTASEPATTSGSVKVKRGVGFFDLASLTGEDQTTYNGENIPGIWLWTGEKYQRIFSSDDKPFISQDGKKYLSPQIFGLDGSELSETGNNKYSISTAYLKPQSVYSPTDVTNIRGFDVEISTLIQNLSGSGENEKYNGGFVFHRELTPITIKETLNYSVKSWPLFSYKDNGQTKDARLLSI